MKRQKAVFLDFDNLFLCIKHRLGEKIANKAVDQLPFLLQKLDAADDVIIKNAYINDKAFARFLPQLTQNGFSIKKCRPITQQGKTVADTEMTADVVTVLLKSPTIEEVILLSDDADFIPVLKRTKEHGVKSTVVTVNNSARAYTSLADNKQSVVALLGLTALPPVHVMQLTRAQKNNLESNILSYLIVGLPIHINDLKSIIKPQFASFTKVVNSLNLAPYCVASGLIFDPKVFCITDTCKSDSQYRVNLKSMTNKQFINAFGSRYPKSIAEAKKWLTEQLSKDKYVELSKIVKRKDIPRLFKRLHFLDEQLKSDFFSLLLPQSYRLKDGFVYDHDCFDVRSEQVGVGLFKRDDNCLVQRVEKSYSMPLKLARSLGLPAYSKQTYVHFFEYLAEGLKRFIGDLDVLVNYIKQKLNLKAINITFKQVKKVILQLQSYGHYFSKQDTPHTFSRRIANYLKQQYRAKQIMFTQEEKQQIKSWLAT